MVNFNGNLLDGKESNIVNWIFSALFWIVTTFILIFSKDTRTGIKDLDFNSLIDNIPFRVIIAFYSFYLILQLTTTGFRKFITIHNIQKVLRENIEKKFKIKYHGESWHEVESTDSDGNTTTSTVVTFNQTVEYKFQSGADYSIINIDSKDINNKRYLDLEISFVYISVDQKTNEEERREYNDFYSRASQDDHFFVDNYPSMKNSHSKNIIYFSNWFIIILDRFIFCIFIILSLGQIYKYIISCFMAKKNIQITKMISNYYDLTSLDSFFNIQPNVILFGENIKYNREKCVFKNRDGLEIMISEKYPLSSSYTNYDFQNKDKFKNYNYNVDNNYEEEYEDENVPSDNNAKLEMEKLINNK